MAKKRMMKFHLDSHRGETGGTNKISKFDWCLQ